MEGCPVVAKVQQLFSVENTLEEKLTIQFDGDIYQKLGDVKARKIIATKNTMFTICFKKTQSSNHQQFIGKICLT